MKQDKREPLILGENTTISLELPGQETVLLSDVNETVLLQDSNETMLLDESIENQTVIHSRELYQLNEGEMLAGRYVIGDILGFGGFGITYSAWDTKLEVKVAIKEYYPANLVNRIPGTKEVEIYSPKKKEEFEKGLNRFLREAQNMAKFSGNKNIVNVYNYFKENKTAYLVMEFLDGMSLKEYTKIHGEKLPYGQVLEFSKCIIAALRVLHKKHIIHRDISPDNIFICKDGTVKLIDFGATRFALETEEEKTLSVVLKPGFAPPEQYRSKGKQGPWTDIYALGATMYRTLTGVVPDESVNRNVRDELKEPKEYVSEIPEYLNKILMKCLALNPELRFRSVDELEQMLDRKKTVKSVQAQLMHRKLIRGFFVMIMIVFLGLIGVSEYRYIRNMKNKANLVPGKITVWVPVEESMEEDEAKEMFETSIQEFQEAYPVIKIQTSYVKKAEYEEKLNQALQNGKAPTVFESSYLKDGSQEVLADLSDTYEMLGEEVQFRTLIEREYEKKQMPTGFSIPLVFKNTTLTEGNETATGNEKKKFLDGKTAVYVGTYQDYPEIQEALAGLYTAELTENCQLEFLNVWGVNATATEDEINAGVRLLYYFMSEKAQDIWYVQNDNGFPLQKSMFDTYIDVNSEFSFVKDIDFTKSTVGNLDAEHLEKLYEYVVNKEGE